MQQLYKLIEDYIPYDHSRQMTSRGVVRDLVAAGGNFPSVLDLGCGDGRSVDLFKELIPHAEWTGVDIEWSPEVSERLRTDAKFVTYNGTELPFQDGSFDLVFSHQVLEHVRFPDLVLSEAYRVLKDNGIFICSTSQFEPYHSYSYWNFTVFGLAEILKHAGFSIDFMRPGIDGVSLIRRSMEGLQKSDEANSWFSSDSPGNIAIDRLGLDHKKANFQKLAYAGQVIVVSKKIMK